MAFRSLTRDIQCVTGIQTTSASRRILIVDDQAAMRLLLRRVCARADREFVECDDGAKALAAYEMHRPDWVIMDIMMPGLDGLSATAQIRKAHAEARIIIITQETDPSFRTAAAEAGAIAFFSKDNLFDVRNLLQQSDLRPGQ
jgi:CheY-like chemotaxis protein